MEYVDSFEASSFSQLSEPPMAHISAVIGHYLFLIGGYRISYENDLRTLTAFDKHHFLYFNLLDLQLNTIECHYDKESIGDFPTEYFCASGVASTCAGNRIYLFGGYSLSKQESVNALYYIDVKLDDKLNSNDSMLNLHVMSKSKPRAVLVFLSGSHDGMFEECHRHYPSYRDKSSMVYWNRCIYVFGGYGSNFVQADNDDQEVGHNFLADNGEYVAGSGNRGWTNQLLVFSLDTNRWFNPKTFGSIPCPRAAHSAALLQENKMFIFGGRLGLRNTSATIRSNHFYYLDLLTMNWTKMQLSDSNIIGRSWTTLTPISNRELFIIGGFSGNNVPLSDACVVDVDIDNNIGVVTAKTNCFQRAIWDPYMDHVSWNLSECFPPSNRMWHSTSLSPDGRVYMFGGCQNNLIFQIEQIQSAVERLIPVPPSLYSICLWSTVKIKPVINRKSVPDRIFYDILHLAI